MLKMPISDHFRKISAIIAQTAQSGFKTCASEIDYNNCESIQDVLMRETQEIIIIHPDDHEELAQLYVSRGETYLLDAQYERAIEDFQNANSHIELSGDVDAAMIIAFRTAFGEVVSYDNLGMNEQTQQALLKLQTIVNHVGCEDCVEHSSIQNMIALLEYSHNISRIYVSVRKDNQDNYSDILGPDQPPESDWCAEVVFGVAGSMQVIAAMAPNWQGLLIKITLHFNIKYS
ncbi:MAG: hypothetical protein AABZ92_05560 [Verrucomicrobiota bacterium]